MLPILSAHCTSLGTPFFGIITIPTSILSDWDGDDSFCGGSHVRQIGDGRYLDPLGGYLGKPEAPVEERHTGSFLRFIRFLRGFLRRLCVHTRFSDSMMTYMIPSHTGFSPHSREGFVDEPFHVRLSGAKEGSLLLLLLCAGASLT